MFWTNYIYDLHITREKMNPEFGPLIFNRIRNFMFAN